MAPFTYILLRKVQSMREIFGEARTAVLAGPGKRDLRLDLLRGIGQWMVFPDHIPYNFLNWFVRFVPRTEVSSAALTQPDVARRLAMQSQKWSRRSPI